MSNRNRTQASPPMSPSERIRRLWPEFKQSVSKSRTLVEHKVEAELNKAEKEYEKTSPERRRSAEQHAAHKARLAKEIRETHFKSARRQWELKLQQVGLRMEDWDVSDDEKASVLDVLGDPGDEPDVAPARQSPPHQSFSSASLSSYATPPQPLAPSLSSSTRSTNVSTASSYALVDPSEFHSEEEDSAFFFPVATSYDLTSDDDDRPAQRKQNGFDAWSSDSSSHHSFDGPSNTRFPSSSLPPNSRKMTSAGKQAASLKAREGPVQKTRQSYLGPIVSDSDEPLSEEEDFERFKMSVRFQKIVEFHQAAAHADIELAIAVYKDRKAQNSDNHEVSSKVTNHQKRMMQLQMEKEEERKNIVKAERSKRRSELRRRPGRSGTVIAPRPSVPANPSWLSAFQEQVAVEVESNIGLDKVLSGDSNEQEGNVEKLLGRLFPAENEDEYNHFAPAISQDEYRSMDTNGWALPTMSFSGLTNTNHSLTPVKRLSNGRSTKQNNTRIVKPSLFGEEPESSDEEDDSPSPPVSIPAHPQHTNPFMNPEADSMLAHQLMAVPELYSYINQWGTTGELPNVPSPTAAWGMGHAAQTPTVDNPDPWKMRDVRSTPVATRRKSSFSASLPTPTQNPYNAFMAEQPGVSLATLAAFNAANANAKDKHPVVIDQRRPAVEPVMRFSPPQAAPAPAAATSLVSTPSAPSSSVQPSTSAVTPQAKADPTPLLPLSGKRPNKKQRQTMKKVGAGAPSGIEDSALDSPIPLAETTPTATVFEQAPHPGTKSTSPPVEVNLAASVNRGRKNSTSAWGELLSTPRPAPSIPAHLQELKPDKPVEQLRAASGMSTIKAPQRGSALKNRTAWSIFSSDEPGPSKLQTGPALPSGGRDPWVPGGFEVDNGGGDDQDDRMVNGSLFSSQFLAAPPSSLDMSLSNATNSKVAPTVPQQPSHSSPSKKSKNKKGKGKKVTVEEVPEDDQDSRGECLPIDHRYIMESNTILEPKPSVPPRMFDSIIGFGNEDEGKGTSSSFVAAADTALSSLPDAFDGDPARFAAALQEMQEASARMEKKFTATPTWGVGNGVKKTVSEPEASTPVFAWDQSIAGDKKKGNASNLVGNNAVPKPAIAPAIHNLKRSKAAAGGKLL